MQCVNMYKYNRERGEGKSGCFSLSDSIFNAQAAPFLLSELGSITSSTRCNAISFKSKIVIYGEADFPLLSSVYRYSIGR
jgi:hypothetical protein